MRFAETLQWVEAQIDRDAQNQIAKEILPDAKEPVFDKGEPWPVKSFTNISYYIEVVLWHCQLLPATCRGVFEKHVKDFLPCIYLSFFFG